MHLLVERLQVEEEGVKVVDWSANMVPLLVIGFAYPVSASRLARSSTKRAICCEVL